MNQTFTLVTKDGIRYQANNIMLSGDRVTFLCSGTWTYVPVDMVQIIEAPKTETAEVEPPAEASAGAAPEATVPA